MLASAHATLLRISVPLRSVLYVGTPVAFITGSIQMAALVLAANVCAARAFPGRGLPARVAAWGDALTGILCAKLFLAL